MNTDITYTSSLVKPSKDIRGQRFGKLIVIEPTDKRADGGSVVWKCHCDCGNDKVKCVPVAAYRIHLSRIISANVSDA